MVRCQGISFLADGCCDILSIISSEFWDSLWISYRFFQTDLISWAESPFAMFHRSDLGGNPVGRANRSQADDSALLHSYEPCISQRPGEIVIAHEWDRATSYPTSFPGVTGSCHLANKFQVGRKVVTGHFGPWDLGDVDDWLLILVDAWWMIIHDRLWCYDIWVTIFWLRLSLIPLR